MHFKAENEYEILKQRPLKKIKQYVAVCTLHWKCKSRYNVGIFLCNRCGHGKSPTSEKIRHFFGMGEDYYIPNIGLKHLQFLSLHQCTLYSVKLPEKCTKKICLCMCKSELKKYVFYLKIQYFYLKYRSLLQEK